MDLIPWSEAAGRPRGLFDRFFEEPWRLVGTWANGAQGGPAIEVLERDDDVIVRAEVAGVDPEDLDVRLKDDAVTIRAERRAEDRGEQQGYFHSERQYGSFVRTVALPAPVDSSRARARFRHGLLEVVAPRRVDETRTGRKLDLETQ